MVERRLAPLWVPDLLYIGPIRIGGRIRVRAQGHLGIWDTHVEDSARFQYADRFAEHVGDFAVNLKELEQVLAVDVGRAAVWKRPGFAEIELNGRTLGEEIHVDPAGFQNGTTA